MIEKGRRYRIPREDRKCPNWPLKDILDGGYIAVAFSATW